MDKQDLLHRLKDDKIEHLWVTYHDYNGRACAKTLPKSKFESAIVDGVIFARANLNFGVHDHNAADGIWQAQTGDFLALPDPQAYWKLPYLENTAIVFSNMMTEAREPFDGCPRQNLTNALSPYEARGIRITAALEAEFSLFSKTDAGDYAPSRAGGMFTVAGLNQFADLLARHRRRRWKRWACRSSNWARNTAPRNSNSACATTIRWPRPTAISSAKKSRARLALKRGLIASYMPKPFTDLAGNGLHVHLALWDAAPPATTLMAGQRSGQPAERNRGAVHRPA